MIKYEACICNFIKIDYKITYLVEYHKNKIIALLMSKIDSIRKFFSHYKIECDDEMDEESIETIYQLCTNGMLIYGKKLTCICANYIGLYYHCQNNKNQAIKHFLISIGIGNYSVAHHLEHYQKQKDYDDMIKYHVNAIEKDGDIIMNNLGCYYQVQKDYDNMIKYYLMAIEKGNEIAMVNLAYHYEIQRDYISMVKYYLMAIEKGNDFAMNRLGSYYFLWEDYENMKKYYLMAINKGNSDAMNNFGYYYEKQGDYKNMLKYYRMAVEKGNYNAMINLGNYYNKQKDYKKMMEYYLMGFSVDSTNMDTFMKTGIISHKNMFQLILKLYQIIQLKKSLIIEKDHQISKL